MHDLSAHIPFNGSPLDRCEAQRTNALWLTQQLESPTTRFIALHDLKAAMFTHPVLAPAYLKADEVPVALENDMTALFLGQRDGKAIYAIHILSTEAEQLEEVGYKFIDIRTIAMQMDGPDLAILGHARSMMSWHLANSFCGKCGGPSRVIRGGATRICMNDGCATEYYPRNDPVVIMLAYRGDKCLLGRQHRFPPGLYSALAGFLEHGESLEEAVRREMFEESGIRIGQVDYVASQAWPFEQSIMIGCMAEALNDDITLDTDELAEAAWFSREDAQAAMRGAADAPLGIPPRMAIAHHLVKYWLEQD